MKDRSMQKKDDQLTLRKRTVVLLALLFLCIGIGAGGLVIHFTSGADPIDPVLPPDTLPEQEQRAVPVGGQEEEKMPQTQGGGSVNLTFSDKVTVSLADREAKLNFQLPARSNQSMVLELLIQDRLIFRSGSLPPGSAVERLPILEDAALQVGGYEGLFRVSFYDPDTGEKAALDAEIPVKVTVAEQFPDNGTLSGSPD